MSFVRLASVPGQVLTEFAVVDFFLGASVAGAMELVDVGFFNDFIYLSLV